MLLAVPDCGHRLPYLKLLEEFQLRAKKQQIYIEMKHVAAMVYCSNDKRGGYTGHFRKINSLKQSLDLDYIKAHSLPGPDLVVHCHIMRNGCFGQTVEVNYWKLAPTCQIPGFRYGIH